MCVADTVTQIKCVMPTFVSCENREKMELVVLTHCWCSFHSVLVCYLTRVSCSTNTCVCVRVQRISLLWEVERAYCQCATLRRRTTGGWASTSRSPSSPPSPRTYTTLLILCACSILNIFCTHAYALFHHTYWTVHIHILCACCALIYFVVYSLMSVQLF